MNAHVRNCASGMIAFAAASAAFPVCAFADEGAGINAILPQMEEFIPMLVAFIILWIVLAKFGWPLFEGMLNKREETKTKAAAVPFREFAAAQVSIRWPHQR